jgi:hypothetical protein
VKFGDDRLSPRFWAKIELIPFSTCWWWRAHLDRKGYGRFQVSGKGVSAYRYAYETLVGVIESGKEMDHFRCSNPACVNPDHLRPVTSRENTLRGNGVTSDNAAKTRCPRGHEYDYARSDGRRRGCLPCERKLKRQRYERLVAAGGERLEILKSKSKEISRQWREKQRLGRAVQDQSRLPVLAGMTIATSDGAQE